MTGLLPRWLDDIHGKHLPMSPLRLGKTTMVPLWSSGFIAGALVAAHAQALTVMFWRFTLAAPLMALIAVVTGARWPRDPRELARIALAGVLLQAVQFSGLYLSLQYGVPAGLAALLAGSSPLLVAVLASFLLGERLERRQWIGSAIGVLGVVVAVAEELHGRVTLAGLLLALLGLAGLTGGTLAQKRFGATSDARSANAVQLAVAALVMIPVAGFTQGFAMPLTYSTLAPFAWLVLALSLGAVLLFFWLLSQEKSGEATSFLYLVPSVTALAAVPILGQPLSVGAVVGLALALVGVRMVSARPEVSPARRARQAIGRLRLGSAG
jgi:drug/metabolite transporter (DMT)-like permease